MLLRRGRSADGMTPYYSEGGIDIYLGDCRDVLPRLDRQVSAVITDPPYGETSLAWDKRVSGWMPACAVITNSLWCFGSLRLFLDLERSEETNGWKHAQEIVWEKQNGSGLNADRFKRVHELAVQFYRGEWADVFKAPVMTLDATARTVHRKEKPAHQGAIGAKTFTAIDGGPRLMTSVIFARNCHGYAEHPTQKPLDILNPLLSYSVPIAGSVCDPFAGSGSTLIAARMMGLSAIGIEINEAYCEIAAKRLGQGVMDFGARV